jgi:hypothetical protein
LAVAAGARAVAFLATQDGKLRGKAARAMVGAWIRAEEPAKTSIFRSMVELSGTNYGTDEEEWSKWATRLTSSCTLSALACGRFRGWWPMVT